MKMTNRYDWRTPDAIHSACVWPDDTVTVRTAIIGELVEDDDAMPMLSGMIGSAELVAQLLRRRATELLKRHAKSSWEQREERALLSHEAGRCIDVAARGQRIANEWLAVTKKRPPQAAYETLIERFGTVYAVTFGGGATVLRAAGQMHWSRDESQFCPMIVKTKAKPSKATRCSGESRRRSTAGPPEASTSTPGTNTSGRG